ncbi:unnamed protein product [Cylindrotheca closterium]|uniref:Uncharacterized protein n=1 Tax=Cylindrotheca closterium TaxID=2856 RepID=A0AAD2FBW1_9STRA|nr:unnamed protein product [Cylindrotheca closterium]
MFNINQTVSPVVIDNLPHPTAHSTAEIQFSCLRMADGMEATLDRSLVDKAIDLKSGLAKLRNLLNVDGESNVPQWAKDRMQELDDHLKEEKFIRSKQEASYDALSKYNKELMGQIEALTKSRDTAVEKLHRSEEAVDLEKKLSQNKEKKWNEEKQKLEVQNSQYHAKIETLNARNAYYQKENEDFKNDHRRAKAIQKELDELNEEMKKKEAENEALKKEMVEKQAASEEQYKQEVQKRETVEKRLEDTKATLNQELKETKSKLEKAEEENSNSAKSLASFLAVIKETLGDKEDGGDDDNSDDDEVDLNLESNVSKIGVALENMQSIVADSQDETDGLKRELKELQEKWHESRGELMDLKEDYEIQEKRCAELEEQLDGMEYETKSKRTLADDDDDQQSYDSRDEHEDEVESTVQDQPGRLQNENEMETTEQGQPIASQTEYESDDSDIVEVQPQSRGPVQRPLSEDEEVRDGGNSKEDTSSDIEEVQPQSRSPAQRPLVEDEEVQDRDDESKEGASSDIEEVQPSDTNVAKRPLKVDEEESHHAVDTNEGGQDQLAPTAKRAKIDDDSDGEGSVKSVTFAVDNENGTAPSNKVEVQPPETSAARRVEDEEEAEVQEVRDGNSNDGEQNEAPTAKRAKVNEEGDSDGSGYGSF